MTHLGSGSGHLAAIAGNAPPLGFGVMGNATDGIGVAGFSTTSHAVDAFCGPQSYDPSNYCFAVYAATAANLPNATAVYASSATGKAGWLETNGGTGRYF